MGTENPSSNVEATPNTVKDVAETLIPDLDDYSAFNDEKVRKPKGKKIKKMRPFFDR